MKNLEKKAIDIKGKKYVLVSDRVLAFNEEYKNGSIQTELISDPESQAIIIKATVIPDSDKPERKFNGYAQEVIGQGNINKTSALENAETSAIGRALAMMGIGVIDSIASVDEINKANNRSQTPQNAQQPASIPVDEGFCMNCGQQAKNGSYGLWCPDCHKKGIPAKDRRIITKSEMDAKREQDEFLTNTQIQPEEEREQQEDLPIINY